MFFCDFYIFPTLSWAFLTLFQLYIIATNRPCEAVGVNEANGFLLPIVLLLEIAQIEKDLPGGFVGFDSIWIVKDLEFNIKNVVYLAYMKDFHYLCSVYRFCGC